MSQDPVDDVLVLNARDHPDRTTAAIANFNVDIEYALELSEANSYFKPPLATEIARDNVSSTGTRSG